MKELFFMANCNTLLALAYIRESENPLSVISNLILYSLYTELSKELRYDNLKSKMIDNFGIQIPNHVIDCCLNYLVKNEKIIKLPQGAGYKLLSSSFNVEQFNNDKHLLAIEEEKFANSICNYVHDNYHLNWEKDEAIKHFSELVLNDNFSESILERKNRVEASRANYINNSWYVKKYIFHLIDNKANENYDYFLKVFNGLIILNGLTQISDYNQNKYQKFRGTVFYLDTKLLLRILGFSAPFYTETALELTRLIRSEYEGKICVFDHVILEAKHALSLAQYDLSKYGSVNNFEMDLFRKENNYTSEDFKIAIDSIETRIKEEFNFSIVPSIDWDNSISRKNCIDTESLTTFITNANPSWNKNAIKNDVDAITQINIERNGDYSVKFGGKKKLPIFVTSNTKLISDIKHYTVDCCSNDIELPWVSNKIPLISDYDLTCRLWLTSYSKEPISLNMIKSAYLYQQSDAVFFEKIRNTYDDVKKKHKYNVVDLDYERFEKLKELVIDSTAGNLENVTDDVVAISFEELAKRQSNAKDEAMRNLVTQSENKEQIIGNLTDTLITSVSERFINKVCFCQKIINGIIGNLPWIIAIIGMILVFILDCLSTSELFGKSKLWVFMPLAISIVFEIIDKKILKDSVITKCQVAYKNKCRKKYENKIIHGLTDQEKEYRERIIKNCIENTTFFSNK